MEKFLNKIKYIAGYIKNYYIPLITLLMLLFMTLFIRECKEKNRIESSYKQNTYALNDGLRTEQNKVNELIYTTTTFVAKLDDLKQLNKDLYNELKKERGDYITFTKLTQLFNKKDTIIIKDTINKYPDNKFGLLWNYKKDTVGCFQYLSGETKFQILFDSVEKNNFYIVDMGTYITKNQLGFDTYINIKKDTDGKFVVTAKTFSNDITLIPITTIDPSAIEEKQNKWNIGPYFGFGLNTKYDGTQSQLGWGIGLSLQYSIFGW